MYSQFSISRIFIYQSISYIKEYSLDRLYILLAQLFLKKTSRYCLSPDVVVVVRRRVKTLTLSNISVITEDFLL